MKHNMSFLSYYLCYSIFSVTTLLKSLNFHVEVLVTLVTITQGMSKKRRCRSVSSGLQINSYEQQFMDMNNMLMYISFIAKTFACFLKIEYRGRFLLMKHLSCFCAGISSGNEELQRVGEFLSRSSVQPHSLFSCPVCSGISSLVDDEKIMKNDFKTSRKM